MSAGDVAGATPVLRVERVSKHYGGVEALSDVSFEVAAGEIVGLLGDNGAGKSTLVKTIAGEHLPSSGTIHVDGRPVVFASPAQARELGIETIYQDLGLVERLGVSPNLFLGRELTYGGLLKPLRVLRHGAMRTRATAALEDLHVRIPEIESRPIMRMSGGQRQAVAIARGAFWGQKLMLLDEPTAALGVRETREALGLIERLKQRGLPMIIVSHNIGQIWPLCDRMIVLRLGRKVADLETGTSTPEEVVGYITGAVS